MLSATKREVVSLQCKLMPDGQMARSGNQKFKIDMDMVELQGHFTEQQREQLKLKLRYLGVEVLDDKKAILAEKVKSIILRIIHDADGWPEGNFSDLICNEFAYNYTYLSNVFSEAKGISIKQFIINQKIEKIKELLLYDELNLSEISYKLKYSSLAHLSFQFKKVTGFTPSEYKHQIQQKFSETLVY